LSAIVTKLAINQIWSKKCLFKMRTKPIATLKHAAEMTLPADNGCCTTTFP